MIAPPTDAAYERLRLLLSTFQDGSGMLINRHSQSLSKTLPGWRDFERATAIAFQGQALEDKSIYDVVVEHPLAKGYRFGISCKMRNTLSAVDRSGRVTIELSNAAGAFWDLLLPLGIHQQNYRERCDEIGAALIARVEAWHRSYDRSHGGTIITEDSYFLTLQYNRSPGVYQLFQYSVDMPSPQAMDWACQGRRLIGKVQGEILIEWYGLSGGQLKYYPRIESATWRSPKFQLEPLPNNLEDILQEKVATYFPEKWNLVR